ncbi:MAG: helix-turn-helix transcriptional regulator [Firmicutes bacterium]|nr:helix-turn-helix transcriptional regulator [Bacillota bacterium]
MGLSQAQLADKPHIDARTILNIENGKGNPKLEILYPLIRA